LGGEALARSVAAVRGNVEVAALANW
jgi:hypothetical protein